MKKVIILFTFLFIFIPLGVKAECSTKEKIMLSKTVNNIQLTPIFDENTSTFSIIVSNLTPNIYFKDIQTQIVYPYTGNEVYIYGLSPNQSYRLKFYSAMSACYGESLSSQYTNLPGYNPYYKDPLCENLEDYKICKKWVNYNYTRQQFEEKVKSIQIDEEEEEKVEKEEHDVKGFYDYLGELYVEYYYIFLPVIIVSLIIAIVYLQKKDDLF